MQPVPPVREPRDWDDLVSREDLGRIRSPAAFNRAIFGRAMCCRVKLQAPDRMDGPDRERARCRARLPA